MKDNKLTNQKKLNDQQKKAVTYKGGPLLIIAGAGTGKTTVITERIAWLIEQKLAKPDEILALTFTNKSAGEMEERVDKLLPYGYVDLWIMTFHSFCEKVLHNHGLDIGIPDNFKLLNETEQWMLVKQNLDKFNLDYYRPLGNPTKFIHALIKHFSRCKDEDIGPKEYLEYAKKLRINLDSMESAGGEVRKQKPETQNQESDLSEIKRLEEISSAYHIYQQLLLDNNSLDFGDLVNYCLKLFRKRKNVLKYYQNKFKYILIDEFQDTNYAQYELMKLLAGKKAKLTVVGDDDQSIYKFRGASVSNILQFKDDYPESKEIFLNKNYRSTQNILDLSYNFIQLNNPERLEFKLQNKNTGRSQDMLANGKLSKKLISNLRVQGIIEHLHCKTEQDEIETVINKIIELYNKEINKFQISWNDFAILIRSNNMADGFMEALGQAGIPYIFLSSRGLYSKPMVMDIIAFLKLVDNYHESRALFKVLNWPIFNINHKDISKITYLARKKAWSLFEALKHAPTELNLETKTYTEIGRILSLIDRETNLARKKSVGQVVLDFIIKSGWEKYLVNQNVNNSTASIGVNNENKEKMERMRHINQFYKKIQDFSISNKEDKSVKNFLEQIEMEMEAGDTGNLLPSIEEGPEAVKIITIHGAKGLEFKYIFIVNLVDKRFPTIERKEPIDLPDELVKEIIPKGDIHLQEERRLFYVAMTRAKKGLFLSSAEDYGGARKKKLSRFLYEAGLVKEGAVKKTKGVVSNSPAYKNLELISRKFLISNLRFDKKEKIEFDLPSKFSFTQLKAYETCPLQYKFAHIFKIPVIGKAQFSFGKTMHSTLQKFFQRIMEKESVVQSNLFSGIETKKQKNKKTKSILLTLDELMEFYNESWIDDWFENAKQKEDYKKKGREILKRFYKKVKDNVPNVKFLEKGFNFKISTPNGDDYSIKGIMDRIDALPDGSLEIIDYKTGATKNIKSIEKDQLLIYQMAAEQLFSQKIGKLTFYYLNDNKPVSFIGTEKDISKQKEKIIDIINGIKSSNFQPMPSRFKCKYCDFKDICENRIL